MAIQKRTFILVCLGLITSNIMAATVALYYSMEVDHLTELMENTKGGQISVNLCIDYQKYNGTIVWYNNTVLPLGSTLKNLTDKVAVVNATWWPAYNSHFIDAINGVWTDAENYYYWMWTYWDDSEQKWVYGNVGATLYVLSNNEILRWRYELPDYG